VKREKRHFRPWKEVNDKKEFFHILWASLGSGTKDGHAYGMALK
jgi:hypothetical protein